MSEPPSDPATTTGTEAGQARLFDDDKDPQAFRTIGEVAQALGIKPHVLRYWEEQFDALEPAKRSGGRRYYRPDDVALLQHINTLINEEGYTIRGAAKALSDRALPLGVANGTAPEPIDAEAQMPQDPEPPRRRDSADDAALVERLRKIRRNLSDGLS